MKYTFFQDRHYAFLLMFLMISIIAFMGCKGEVHKEGEKAKAPRHPIEAKAEVDKAEAQTGDEITYTLTIDAIPEIQPRIPEMGALIHGLRIVDMGEEGPNEIDRRKVWKIWYRLNADFSGSYIIPAVKVLYKGADGKEQEATAPQIYIEVKAGEKGGKEQKDINDIKPIAEIKLDLTKVYLLGGIGLLTLIIIGAGIWFYVYKKKQRVASEPVLPAYEIALRALDGLKGSSYLEQADLRSFYFTLSEILRSYMERRFGFPAQESTTEELVPRIERLDLARAQKDMVRVLARGEDLVKFARHIPSRETAEKDWEDTRGFVLATREPAEKTAATEVGDKA